MANKQQNERDREKKFNLGQREASLEKDKETELGHMGELSKKAEQHGHKTKADRKR